MKAIITAIIDLNSLFSFTTPIFLQKDVFLTILTLFFDMMTLHSMNMCSILKYLKDRKNRLNDQEKERVPQLTLQAIKDVKTNFSTLNWNIRYLFANTIFNTLAMSIFYTVVFSVLVKSIVGTNLGLGIVSSIVGFISFFSTVVGGWLADRWRRDVLIKISNLFSAISIILFVFLTNDWFTLVVLLTLNGLATAFGFPAYQALIADSVPQGDRSRIYSYFFFLQNIIGVISPFFSIVMALYLGNVWTLEFLRSLIILVGIFQFIGFLTTLFLSDDKALEHKNRTAEITTTQNEDTSAAAQIEPKLKERVDLKIPLILITAALLIGFGAGVTIRFFQIFFVEVYNTSPICWSIVLIVTSVSLAFGSIFLQRLSKRIGRVQAIVISQTLAIICLVLIATYPPFLLVMILYALRTTLMNAPGPLHQSIVMDIIPSEYRGKWVALESLAWGIFNSAAAIVGGFIIDNFGFTMVFLFTASLYTLATLIVVPLVKVIPKDEQKSIV